MLKEATVVQLCSERLVLISRQNNKSHLTLKSFLQEGTNNTITGTVDFLRGQGPRNNGSVTYNINLSGEMTGDRFSVGLTKNCSVKPDSEHVSIIGTLYTCQLTLVIP